MRAGVLVQEKAEDKQGASHVALAMKKLPTSAGDIRDMDSIPG